MKAKIWFARTAFALLFVLLPIACASHRYGSVPPSLFVLRSAASARPAAGFPGRLHFASDTKAASFDDGSNWQDITQGASLLPTLVPTTPPSAGSFSWINQVVGATKTTNLDGSLSVVTPLGGSGNNRTLLTIPAISRPYTLTIGLMPTMPLDNHPLELMGIALTDGTKIAEFAIYGDLTSSTHFTVDEMDNPTTSHGAPAVDTIVGDYHSLSGPIFMRIVDDNSTRDYQASNGGRGFNLIHSEPTNNFVTPTGVGVIFQSFSAANPNLRLRFDIFHLTLTTP